MSQTRFPRVKAEGRITLSAIVVFAVFFYRKFTKNDTASTGHFMIGFFFAYGALGVIALAAPEVAGMFALLIMAGDLLANGQELASGVSGSLKSTAGASSSAIPQTAPPTAPGTPAPLPLPFAGANTPRGAGTPTTP